jgi:general secretion pathway protein G
MRCNVNLNLGSLAGSGKGRKWISAAGYTLIELLIVVALISTLATIAIFAVQGYRLKAQNSAAMADVMAISGAITTYWADNGYPDDLSQIPGGNRLDPWGNPYQYLRINGGSQWQGKCRRDRSLNPINNDFDLYSMGADGQTAKPLTANASQDDIVRANNGSFVGLGADY